MQDSPVALIPFDEMLLPNSMPRQTHSAVFETLMDIGAQGLEERARQRDAYLDRHGITFTLGERERPLPMDLVPRLITAPEWNEVESGVAQRIRALELFLADIYGPGRVLAEGLVPRSLITTSSHFHRQAWGISSPNGVRIHVSGIDLIRDESGKFRVLEDNLRNPSGVSYVLENRRTLAHVLPEVFSHHQVRSVSEYPERLLEALKASAPAHVSNPVVVVLSPGVHNSAHYEHAFLARNMGVELVEGRDLYCRDNTVWMRTTSGPEPVHVIYRRIDDDFLDPVHLRPDSVLGVPGIVNAARAGGVTVANAIGNGVADDKALYPYVPALIRYYLDEEPILPNVDTYDLTDQDQQDYVVKNLESMVVKPSDGSGGYGLVMGPSATDQELVAVTQEIKKNPRAWIAQPVVTFSTCPTVVEGGEIAPRHVDLRPFAVNDGSNIYVLPGGLSRVALPKGSLVVNSSQGGGSKDTWVIDETTVESNPVHTDATMAEGAEPGSAVPWPPRAPHARSNSPTAHDDRLVQQERQQQQTSIFSGSKETQC
jgi:uncharacterized circularly permuted ATP-grasp superfamily protein